MKSINGKVALVTGASSGIGKAFAYKLAEMGAILVLTARREDNLKELALKLNTLYKAKVYVFTADLSKKEAPQQLYNQILNSGLTIDLLINNAGYGKWTNFLDETIEEYDDMLELNINAVVKLTHLFIPAMLKKGSGGIINVASTGALQPCPYVGVYCASKSFVLAFSEALYGEYHKKGLTITALCPGNTSTGFQSIAKANTQGMSADLPDTVAEAGIKSLLKGKSFKIVGFANYLTSFVPRFFPRKTVINIVSKMMYKKVNG
ncbi:SDR family NAD(P)-dependent oxidoreductase [Pedobacter nototheniae]|uniref:SDR family NAD(P)-dependent oxidoreductase n=1 Tax=Pedobacter nototheniae TaxID=2488994 RepID=UPI00103E1FED|nr:SDR family oxidoreductase [Pedobacter nototheniae]